MKRHPHRSPLYQGQDRSYSNEESQFLREISRFREANHRIPTPLEALQIAKTLGYRKETQEKSVIDLIQEGIA